jgi:predicted lactoylglutathione lyase
MKKTMPQKNKRARESNNLEVNVETVTILRTVGDNEAFNFYEALGKPTGETARNLTDFLEKVKSVKLESLVFHLQRNDFQNWIEKTLGDSKLAGKLKMISSSNRDDVRMNIHRTVENRIKELRESSCALLVAENSTVLLPSH